MGQGRRILSLARCNLGDGREMANADPRGPSAGMPGMRARGGKRLVHLRASCWAETRFPSGTIRALRGTGSATPESSARHGSGS